MRYPYVLLLLACRASVSMAAGQIDSVPNVPQAPTPTGKTYPVSGTVFNTVTNQPVGHALVHINGNGQDRVGFSGADGRFQIASVPEGPVYLSAQRPGYFDPRTSPFGNGGIQSAFKPQVVTSGSNDFRVGLMPESRLVGKVVDGDGEPIEDLPVQLMAQQISQGRKQWVSRGFASSDDRGEFRFGGQMPGPVVVCTAGKSETPMAAHNAQSYPPRCYPNSPDIESAQRIDLLPGQEAETDFTLGLAPGYTVTGRIVGFKPGLGMNLSIDSSVGWPGTFGRRIEPATGRFFIRAVPNGVWTVHAQVNNMENGGSGAQEEIAINGADVQGVELRLQRGIDIPVIVNPAQGSAPENQPPSVQVHLVTAEPGTVSIDSRRREYYSSQLANAEGGTPPRVAVQGVQPGQYKVLAQTFGPAGCVGTVTYGSSDLTRQPLTVTAGEGQEPVVVSLRSDCASVSVSVHGAPANSSVMLIAVPDDLLFDPQPIGLPTDQQGSAGFNLPNLRPGNYHVYAVSDLNDLEYMNPDAMRNVPSQSLTFDANQKASITFELSGRSAP